MKYSALLIASVAMSAGSVEGSQLRHYDDELRYPFGSPYSYTETTNHEKEMKTFLKPTTPPTATPAKKVTTQSASKPAPKAAPKAAPKPAPAPAKAKAGASMVQARNN